MKEYFKEQIKYNTPITDMKRERGKPLYGEYKKNDVILYFFERIGKLSIVLRTSVLRDIERLENDYRICVPEGKKIPILEKKGEK